MQPVVTMSSLRGLETIARVMRGEIKAPRGARSKRDVAQALKWIDRLSGYERDEPEPEPVAGIT